MKKLMLLLVILLSGTSAFAVDNPWDTKLPYKNMVIDSEVSGSMSGEKTLYITDYGRVRAEYTNTTMKIFGMTQEQKEIIITTPEWVYTADLVENTGTQQANIKKYLAEEFDALSKSDQKKVVKNAESLGMSTVAGLEGTVEEKATKLLGYKCDKVSMAGTIVFTISGTDLVLKTDSDMMGMKISEVATSVKEEKGPSSKFDLPSDINFEHNERADRMMQEQAKSTIQRLLAGTAGETSNSAYNSTQSVAPVSSPEPQGDSALEQDVKDVGQAARDETKDATTDEVRKGVRGFFNGLFN